VNNNIVCTLITKDEGNQKEEVEEETQLSEQEEEYQNE
jgi:hypothetical protein